VAEPVRARRLTDQEGSRLQQIVRQGKHGSIRVRRAMIIMASASGTPVSAIARLVAADQDTVRDVIHLFNAKGLAGPGRELARSAHPARRALRQHAVTPWKAQAVATPLPASSPGQASEPPAATPAREWPHRLQRLPDGRTAKRVAAQPDHAEPDARYVDDRTRSQPGLSRRHDQTVSQPTDAEHSDLGSRGIEAGHTVRPCRSALTRACRYRGSITLCDRPHTRQPRGAAASRMRAGGHGLGHCSCVFPRSRPHLQCHTCSPIGIW
jgi:hypothetical protein